MGQKYRTIDEAKALLIMPMKQVDSSKEKNEIEKVLKDNKSKYTFLKTYYKFVDKINEPYKELSICSTNCTHCCKIAVQVSRLEASYIEKNTDFNISINMSFNVNDPCPFLNLEKGMCSIYEYRPLACRGYFVYDDPVNCKNLGTDQVQRTAEVFANELKQFMSKYKNLGNSKDINDIRFFFKI